MLERVLAEKLTFYPLESLGPGPREQVMDVTEPLMELGAGGPTKEIAVVEKRVRQALLKQIKTAREDANRGSFNELVGAG